MKHDWQSLTLRQADVALIDCEHRTPPASNDGFPYIAIPQIKNGRLDLSEARKITTEHFEDWTRKAMPRPFDVVLSRRCNPGETAFIPPGLKCALGQNLVLLRASGEQIFPPFLRWLARGSEWWDQVERFLNMGAVFESLKCADIPNFEFSVPPIDEQRAIARVLGSLDDKIELNRRMNRTLEELAAALFRSWFVDFDPVVAKAAGRKPVHLRPDLAALFPATFQDSTIGPIPHGWRVATLSEVASINTRKMPRDYPHKDIEYLDISSVTEGIISGTTRVVRSAAPSRAQRLVEHGDTIWSCVRPNRRSFALIQNPPENMVVSTGFATLTPTCGSSAFVYAATTTDDFTDYLTAHAEGSAYPAVRPETFETAPMVVSPPNILKEFEKIASPWLAMVAHNVRESRTLSALRDTLLPKLLSGELRVKSAEKLVEAKI